MTYFYEVIFPKLKSPIKSRFTYHFNQKLELGDLVNAELRKTTEPAIIVNQVEKPVFKTKPIQEIIQPKFLQEWQLKLTEFITSYYFANESKTLNLFFPKKFTVSEDQEANSSELEKQFIESNPPNFKLNQTQNEILDFLHQSQNKIHLIHGITGSGKTIIYLKRVEEVLKQGKQVLILIPEISLTPQTISIFTNYFTKDILSLYHSKLNSTEKTKEWYRIKNQESKIIIGSRSSLFLPFQNLGLVIMDEEHDNAYKQEQNPRYHTRTILQWLNQNLKTEIIIGSATPSLETFAASLKQDKIIKHEILHRSQHQDLPNIQLIDLKDELKKGNHSPISEKLSQAIQENLDKKELTLLLHNKRGFANYLICQDCGKVIECPHCSISLTLHKTPNGTNLMCHYCSHTQKIASNCSTCGGVNLKSIGSGIQKIVEETQKMFPTARILRVDSDTTSTKNAHSEIYESIKQNHYDIIIGTQMIATGLDISGLSLVGVTNADISLNMPDFRAAERTFQLLTQVSGRSGREQKQGQVIIQTFNPDNPVLNCVKNHDFNQFYSTELQFRQEFNYPPFAKLTKLTYSHPKIEKLIAEIQRVELILKNNKVRFKSAPALIEKKSNKYYHHILINSLNPENIIPQLNLDPDWWVDRDPVSTI
jgi:primosomal protein N' (replication factor Y)